MHLQYSCSLGLGGLGAQRAQVPSALSAEGLGWNEWTPGIYVEYKMVTHEGPLLRLRGRVSSLGFRYWVRFGSGSVAITQSAYNPKHACEISGNLQVGSYQF